jgi:hypothetical protein
MTASSLASFRTLVASVGLGLLAVFFAWFGSQIKGFPEPIYHDEFAYLLAGETFASGRLTNPSHPMGWFFETYHQLQFPSYSSKYPPAQGIVLALGFLLGAPIYGVWISHGILTALTVWMARAYSPLRYAVWVGAVVGLWFGFLCYWVQSYWGGTVAAIGGVLIWGGTKRWIDYPRLLPAMTIGAGAGLLLLSRPFEGFLACFVPGLLIARELLRMLAQKVTLPRLATILGVLGPVLVAAVFQLLLNRAVTGDAFTLPYQEYNRQYDSNPILFWQNPRVPPQFNHARMENFDLKVAEPLTSFRIPLIAELRNRIFGFSQFFGAGFLVVVPLFLALRPSRQLIWLLGALAMSLSSIIWVYYFFAHYLAPIVGVLTLLLLLCARHFHLLVRKHAQISSTRAVIGFSLLFSFMLFTRQSGSSPQEAARSNAAYRQSLLQRLAEEPGGKHLVMVDYEAGVNPHVEYVFNSADIDQQTVVWARWSSDAGKRGLFAYYKDRQFWLLRVSRAGEPVLRQFSWVPEGGHDGS